MNEALNKIRILDEEQRADAKRQARKLVIADVGPKPTRDQFSESEVSEYPRWLTVLVMIGLVVVFLASFAMSIFRLFTAGRDYFLIGIGEQWQASVAGVAIFLMAEFTVIMATLTRKVYFGGRSRLMWIPILIGVVLAITGNWVVSKPHDFFGWLETLSPPVVVLFMSIIGESIILKALQARQRNERLYQDALAIWQGKTAQPEKHERFVQVYANVLRKAVWDANFSKWAGSADALRALAVDDWRSLVSRELQAEHWFVSVSAAPVVLPITQEVQPVAVPLSSNGHHNGNGTHASIPS